MSNSFKFQLFKLRISSLLNTPPKVIRIKGSICVCVCVKIWYDVLSRSASQKQHSHTHRYTHRRGCFVCVRMSLSAPCQGASRKTHEKSISVLSHAIDEIRLGIANYSRNSLSSNTWSNFVTAKKLMILSEFVSRCNMELALHLFEHHLNSVFWSITIGFHMRIWNDHKMTGILNENEPSSQFR